MELHWKVTKDSFLYEAPSMKAVAGGSKKISVNSSI